MKRISLLCIFLLSLVPGLFGAETAEETAAPAVTKENYRSMLTGSRDQKIAALNFVVEKKVTEAQDILNTMLDHEKDTEVFIKAILTVGALQLTDHSKRIVQIYETSGRSEVRFACILSLMQLQDPKTLKDIKKAYEQETDPHTKQALQLIMDALKSGKK